LIRDSLSWLYCSHFLNNNETIEELIKTISAKIPAVPLKNYYNQVKAATHHNAEIILQKIKSPTVIFQGDEDILCKKQEAMALSSSIKNSQFIVIDNAAHMIPIENPDSLAKHINHILKNSRK
jgi:pimeloyl-ACP methyl ester carboxylesterase